MKIKLDTINQIYKFNFITAIICAILIIGERDLYFTIAMAAIALNALIFIIKDKINKGMQKIDQLRDEIVAISIEIAPKVMMLNEEGVKKWHEEANKTKENLKNKWEEAGGDTYKSLLVDKESIETCHEKLKEILEDEQYTQKGDSKTTENN